MTYQFQDENERELFAERFAICVVDGDVPPHEAQSTAWAAVLRWRAER